MRYQELPPRLKLKKLTALYPVFFHQLFVHFLPATNQAIRQNDEKRLSELLNTISSNKELYFIDADYDGFTRSEKYRLLDEHFNNPETSKFLHSQYRALNSSAVKWSQARSLVLEQRHQSKDNQSIQKLFELKELFTQYPAFFLMLFAKFGSAIKVAMRQASKPQLSKVLKKAVLVRGESFLKFVELESTKSIKNHLFDDHLQDLTTVEFLHSQYEVLESQAKKWRLPEIELFEKHRSFLYALSMSIRIKKYKKASERFEHPFTVPRTWPQDWLAKEGHNSSARKFVSYLETFIDLLKDNRKDFIDLLANGEKCDLYRSYFTSLSDDGSIDRFLTNFHVNGDIIDSETYGLLKRKLVPLIEQAARPWYEKQILQIKEVFLLTANAESFGHLCKVVKRTEIACYDTLGMLGKVRERADYQAAVKRLNSANPNPNPLIKLLRTVNAGFFTTNNLSNLHFIQAITSLTGKLTAEHGSIFIAKYRHPDIFSQWERQIGENDEQYIQFKSDWNENIDLDGKFDIRLANIVRSSNCESDSDTDKQLIDDYSIQLPLIKNNDRLHAWNKSWSDFYKKFINVHLNQCHDAVMTLLINLCNYYIDYPYPRTGIFYAHDQHASVNQLVGQILNVLTTDRTSFIDDVLSIVSDALKKCQKTGTVSLSIKNFIENLPQGSSILNQGIEKYKETSIYQLLTNKRPPIQYSRDALFNKVKANERIENALEKYQSKETFLQRFINWFFSLFDYSKAQHITCVDIDGCELQHQVPAA